jgi:hypothetical protein
MVDMRKTAGYRKPWRERNSCDIYKYVMKKIEMDTQPKVCEELDWI